MNKEYLEYFEYKVYVDPEIMRKIYGIDFDNYAQIICTLC